MDTIDLKVEGMSCGSCVKHVTQALQKLAGVGDVQVDLQAGRIRVTGELAAAGPRLVAALGTAGYPAELAAGPALQAPAKLPALSGKSGAGGCCCR